MNFSSESCPDTNGIPNSPLIGRVFNIQRYSLNDGEGIRTIVFFKGCPLHCPWCSNPESRFSAPQIIRRKSKCRSCEICVDDVDECPTGALELVGVNWTLEELLKEIEKDDVFYRSSGGGVTLSGGEVLTQAPFAIELLKRLKRLGNNTAIETTGHGNSELLRELCSYCDEVLYDFKMMDAEAAKHVIGINVPRVLDNFRMLFEFGVKLIPRIPLIPGFTMSEQNIEAVLDFLARFDLPEVHLLPFHQYGAGKYESFNMDYKLWELQPPTQDQIETIKARVEARGHKIVIGG